MAAQARALRTSRPASSSWRDVVRGGFKRAALADSVLEVQLAAARALGRLKQPEPLAAVVESSAAPIFVAASMRALAQADPERAVALAAARVRHSEPAIACAAVEVVGGALAGPGGGEEQVPTSSEVLNVIGRSIRHEPTAPNYALRLLELLG